MHIGALVRLKINTPLSRGYLANPGDKAIVTGLDGSSGIRVKWESSPLQQNGDYPTRDFEIVDFETEMPDTRDYLTALAEFQ